MNIVIFEEVNSNNFYPVSLTRPLWEVRSGCFIQRERFEIFFDKNGYDRDKVYYFTRDYLKPFFNEKYPELKINDYSFLDSGEDTLFLGSLLIPDERISSLDKNSMIVSNDMIIAALVEPSLLGSAGGDIAEMLSGIQDLNTLNGDASERAEYIWDLIADNGKRIRADYDLLNKSDAGPVDDSVAVIGDRSNLFIEKDVRIDPFVCIDLSHGPVIIRKGSVINSFTRIEGPCCIGRDCIILGAKVREGCSLGDCCRAGGEIEESIFHGYSNKYHDGFIGHSYIGEWVNLGAMTTNSDLKNDYSEIKVYIPTKRLNTNSIKVGCFIGDFVKTSIGTLIITGASIGTGSMAVHAGTFVPYHVPPYSWFIENKIIGVSFFGDFIESCRAMTSRRGVEFSDTYKDLIIKTREITDDIREKELLKWKRMQK